MHLKFSATSTRLDGYWHHETPSPKKVETSSEIMISICTLVENHVLSDFVVDLGHHWGYGEAGGASRGA